MLTAYKSMFVASKAMETGFLNYTSLPLLPFRGEDKVLSEINK